jgi:hypothetical protein
MGNRTGTDLAWPRTTEQSRSYWKDALTSGAGIALTDPTLPDDVLDELHKLAMIVGRYET